MPTRMCTYPENLVHLEVIVSPRGPLKRKKFNIGTSRSPSSCLYAGRAKKHARLPAHTLVNSASQWNYTVGHKTHQNVFRHHFRKTRRILNKFGRLLLK